jgi:hypothetical protein
VYSSQERPPRNGYEERYVARDLDTGRDMSARPALKAARGRVSIGRRIFRTLSRFFLAVLLGVAATLSWQSHGEEAKEMVATWAPSLSPLLSALPTNAPVAASTSPGSAPQLEPMARELAAVRRSLEQLAAKQEQMLATLNAVERPSSSVPSWMVPILPSNPQQPAAKSSLTPSSVPARQPLVLDRVGSR